MARSRPITFLASGEVPTLQAAGYDVRAIANPLQDLATDSEYVADYLKTIHGPVIRAGHSYGGASRTPRPDSPTSRRWPTSTLPPPRPAKPTPAQWSRLHPGKNTPAQLFFTTSYPGAPAGASELYLNENIFIHNFANDLPRREAEPLWASQRGASRSRSARRRRRQLERPSHPGTSSARAIRSSRPSRTRHGPACTLAHHHVPRRIAPDTDLTP